MPQEIHWCCCVPFANAHQFDSSFADVDMGTSAAGDTVHRIFRSAGEMISNREGAFRASYISERSDELAGLIYEALKAPSPSAILRMCTSF